MRILQKFYALISRGEPADPDEPVELVVVRATSPLGLSARGIFSERRACSAGVPGRRCCGAKRVDCDSSAAPVLRNPAFSVGRALAYFIFHSNL